jgi:hypothetical protein
LNPQHRNYNRRQRRRRDHSGRDLREHQDPQGGVTRREDAAVEHAEEAQVGHPGQDLHKEARRCVAGTPGAEPIDEGHAGEVEHLSYKSESSTDVGDGFRRREVSRSGNITGASWPICPIGSYLGSSR